VNVSDAPLLRHAAARVHGRYFVRPARTAPGDLWLVGFHGQAQTADVCLADLERIPRGPSWLVASVQGLNRYYAGRSQAIVANWMTSQDREIVIADNVAWVDAALDALEAEFGAARAIVFAGFSQGVAMAYRAALLCRRTCAAVIAVGGDVPPALRTAATRAWPRVLAATGERDGWYTPARLETDMTFLRTRRPDAEALVFDGGHEWTDEVAAAAGRLLEEIGGDASR
jgi:predicted esterase